MTPDEADIQMIQQLVLQIVVISTIFGYVLGVATAEWLGYWFIVSVRFIRRAALRAKRKS